MIHHPDRFLIGGLTLLVLIMLASYEHKLATNVEISLNRIDSSLRMIDERTGAVQDRLSVMNNAAQCP